MKKPNPSKRNPSDYGGHRKVDCICPRCGKRHRMGLFWTGRWVPRKFCPTCEHAASITYSHAMDVAVMASSGRKRRGRE